MIKRSFWIFLAVLALLALTTTVAWAGGEGTPGGQENEGTTDVLWITLAPLLAIATSVERVLEMIWERWEKAGLWPHPAGEHDTSDPEYIRKKKARSHWLGMLIAVGAIGLTNVRFFRLLGFDVLLSSPDLILFNAGIGGIFDDFTVGTLIDWLMTAGIIGWGGTELTHSIIEGLVKGRGLWKEMQEVEAGHRSILDAELFTDYIVPALEERGVSVGALRQTIQTLNAVGVPVDQFIESMTTGKVDQFIEELESQPETAEAGKALRDLLEGVPPEKKVEIPDILDLLPPELRKRFLGA
jgi:hypothetical protein